MAGVCDSCRRAHRFTQGFNFACPVPCRRHGQSRSREVGAAGRNLPSRLDGDPLVNGRGQAAVAFEGCEDFAIQATCDVHHPVRVLEVDGQIVSNASILRSFVGTDVRIDEVRERGIVGRFFMPALTGKVPAIIIVGGSEGGMESAEYWAKLLASHGYCAIAIAYFRAEGLPDQLAGIPVETVKTALDYLAARPEVDPDRIAILGTSRGSELALLAGASFPQIKAVAAYSPSNSSWAALVGGGPQKAAWTIGGNPVPFVPNPPRELVSGIKEMTSGLSPLLQGLFLSYGHAVQRAEIPVERINGGMLLVSGQDDRVWPSSAMSDLIVSRLNENGFRYPVVNLSYEAAGHLINFPFFPTPSRIELGGTPEGLARADAESWSRVLEFLGTNLRPARSKDP